MEDRGRGGRGRGGGLGEGGDSFPAEENSVYSGFIY